MRWYQRIFLVLILPVVIASAIIEPVWLEICRIFTKSELWANWKTQFAEVKDIYSNVFFGE